METEPLATAMHPSYTYLCTYNICIIKAQPIYLLSNPNLHIIKQQFIDMFIVALGFTLVFSCL